MNLFAVSSVLTTFASLGFGLFVYAADRTSRLGRRWLTLSILIGSWALGLWGVTTAESLQAAALWQMLLDLSAFLIPLAYFLFVLTFLRASAPFAEAMMVSGAGGLVILKFSGLYASGLSDTGLGFYWIQPGPLYVLFPAYYAVGTLASIIFLVRAYRRLPKGSAERGQILNHVVAAAVGFSGGATNFFPQLFDIYPFGNYFVILYVALMSYAVIRYRVFNIKLISAQLFAGGFVLASIFNLFDSSSLDSWIIHTGILAIVSVFGFQLVRSVYREIAQRELIEEQAKDLERANAQQETLLHFISHEIKGYLAKGEAAFAEIAEEGAEVSPSVRSIAARALQEMRKGVGVVMGLLDASNLKKGTVSFKKDPLDFRAIVERVARDLRPTAEEKCLHLDLRIGAGIYAMAGDEEKLREHVVRNLIDNAINYTPAGIVHVALSKNDGAVRLVVQDSGVGITKEDMQHLFTEGGHGKDSLKINVHSTGYGLFIAKQVTEAHGGKIWAESDGPGKGSTFTIELPATSSTAIS